MIFQLFNIKTMASIQIRYTNEGDNKLKVETSFDKDMNVNDVLNALAQTHDVLKNSLNTKYKKRTDRREVVIGDLFE